MAYTRDTNSASFEYTEAAKDIKLLRVAYTRDIKFLLTLVMCSGGEHLFGVGKHVVE